MTSVHRTYRLRVAEIGELGQAVAIDAASAALFAAAGCAIVIADDHPYLLSERQAWQSAIVQGDLWFMCAAKVPVGFYALSRRGLPYLEQLSVRPEHGRQGLGSALLEAACQRSKSHGDTELWLTTYAHFAWNKPFYERHGFQVVPEAQSSDELRAELAAQRAILPAPSQRVVMKRRLA